MTLLIIACIGGCKAAEPAAVEPVPFESTDEPAGLVPLKAFASLPLVRTMELSPSGAYLASIQNVGSKTYLVTTTHDGKDLRRLFECNNVAYFLNWFQWINDDRLLVGVYVVDVKIGGISDLKWIQTRVLAINRDGTDLQTNLIPPDFDGRAFRYGDTPQIQDSVIGTIPGDDRAVLIALDLKSSTYPDVFKLNVYTGERELVERNTYGIRDWTADRQSVIRLGTAVDGTIIHHLVKPPGSDEWRTLSKFDVTRETGMTPLGFDEDPNILFVRQPLEGRAAVYRLDLSKPDSPPQLLASHPVYDVEGDMIYGSNMSSGRTIEQTGGRSFTGTQQRRNCRPGSIWRFPEGPTRSTAAVKTAGDMSWRRVIRLSLPSGTCWTNSPTNSIGLQTTIRTWIRRRWCSQSPLRLKPETGRFCTVT